MSSTSMKFTAIFNSLPHLFKMSDPYDLGTEITGSRQGNKNLSPEVRAAIWASVKAREKKDRHRTPLQY